MNSSINPAPKTSHKQNDPVPVPAASMVVAMATNGYVCFYLSSLAAQMVIGDPTALPHAITPLGLKFALLSYVIFRNTALQSHYPNIFARISNC